MTMEASPEPLQRVLDSLHRVRRSGSGWTARCPTHPDRNPSLSISQGEKGVVLHCHAGCEPRDIAAALGMTLKDLFYDNRPLEAVYEPVLRPWAPAAPAAAYVYHDASGEAVAVVRRAVGADGKKTFRQYRIEGGQEIPGIGKLELPLYRLPQALQALRDGSVLFVVEGEKDADTAASMGLAATTNPMGAGKWRDWHTQSLRGIEQAVVVADDDVPGKKHAEDVAARLRGLGAEVEVVLPHPGCKDLTEHVEAGHGLDDLRPLTDSRMLPVVDWADVWDKAEEIEWIIEPLIPLGKLVSIYSPPKAGKSLLMLELAAAAAAGFPVIGRPAPDAQVVLYIDFENTVTGDIVPRLKDMGYKPEHLRNLRYMTFPTIADLDTPEGGDTLVANAEHHGATLVVIDTVGRAVGGKENDNDTWQQFYKHTGMKLKAAGIGLVRLDHSGKDETRGQRGGSSKSGDVDAVWRMGVLDHGVVELECEIKRYGAEPPARIVLKRHLDPLRHIPDQHDARQSRIDTALEDLREARCPGSINYRDFDVFLRDNDIACARDIRNAVRRAWNAQIPPF